MIYSQLQRNESLEVWIYYAQGLYLMIKVSDISLLSL